jgi:hypothetical protein
MILTPGECYSGPRRGIRAVESVEVFGKAAGRQTSFGDLFNAKVD